MTNHPSGVMIIPTSVTKTDLRVFIRNGQRKKLNRPPPVWSVPAFGF
jgi:hypothetical protein